MKATLTQGLTTVKIDTEISLYEITHSGSMGNDFNDVDKNLLRLGFPTLEEYRQENEVVEEGSPDYLYKMTVTI